MIHEVKFFLILGKLAVQKDQLTFISCRVRGRIRVCIDIEVTISKLQNIDSNFINTNWSN
jgi:hypothetical protein